MAIIYSYPKKLNPQGSDVFIITDPSATSKNKNRTKSVDLDAIATYVITSQSAITGSGTLDRIPIFTGPTNIGDSIIRYNSAGNFISVGASLTTNLGDGFIASPVYSGTDLFITNISSAGIGTVTLKGDVIIGDQATDVLQITSSVTDSTGTGSTAAGEVLVSNAAGQLVWGTDGGGTVTGTGTTDAIVKFTDGPNGVVGDSTIIDSPGETIFNQDVLFNGIFQGDNGGAVDGQLDMISGGPILFQDPAGAPTGRNVFFNFNGNEFRLSRVNLGRITLGFDGSCNIRAENLPSGIFTSYNFGTGGTFRSDNYEFRASGGGFYNSSFIFKDTLAIDRTNTSTFASLDVGTPTSGRAAAYFRNGVVISNNPAGVSVDNTSVVIGAGNNDVVTGSDNCLAVGNNNQILSNSDHSVAIGLGNAIRNNGTACLAVGQGNTIDGTGLPAGTTARSYILGLNNTLTGSFSSFIAGGANNITTEQNAMILGFNNTANGIDNVYALGETNTLNDANANGVFMIGNGITGQDGNMVLGFRNDTTGYPTTDYANGLGNTKLVLSTGTVTNSNALIITEGGVTRGGGTAQEPRIVMPSIVAFDYADDIAAAAAGIPVGGIYHNAGALRIRRT